MQRTEDFRISGIVWHEIGMRSMFLGNDLEDLLNQSFKIKAYGEVLDWICIVHIIASETIHEPYKRYSRKYKNLYVQYKLDYDQFVQANDAEAMEMMALSFLDILRQFPKWRIRHFDWKGLYEDAEKLFLEKGLIQTESIVWQKK